MFSAAFSLLSVLTFVLPYIATATPVHPVELLVWSPTITSPTASTVWKSGSLQTVSWKTENIPKEEQNATGLLLLGYMENNSENLDIKHPLAAKFPISAGSVSFNVPQDVTPRTDAIVVLFGDSGNASPEFTITK